MSVNYIYEATPGECLEINGAIMDETGALVDLTGAYVRIEAEWTGGAWSDDTSGGVAADASGWRGQMPAAISAGMADHDVGRVKVFVQFAGDTCLRNVLYARLRTRA